MCEYCYSSPHLRGCPAGGDDGEKYANKCSYCGRSFQDGEGIVLRTEAYCDDCIDDFDLDDVLQIFGCDSAKDLLKELV